MNPTVIALYVDGGVIGTNPSMIGGTFAYKLIRDDGSEQGQASVITTSEMGSSVTNNQTEMLALLTGLKQLPVDFNGTIYSDSQVTLGRAFLSWKWKNIPTWMHKLYQEQRSKFIHWDEIRYVLLDGHPTKAQLKAGFGKRGHPVSEHNVWCDKACGEAGAAFLETIGQKHPVHDRADDRHGVIMARKPYHKSKHGKAAPVVLPEAPDVRKAKHLPMFGPGIVLSIPLGLWPAYAELYHLGTFRRSMKAGVDLLVKREVSHGK